MKHLLILFLSFTSLLSEAQSVNISVKTENAQGDTLQLIHDVLFLGENPASSAQVIRVSEGNGSQQLKFTADVNAVTLLELVYKKQHLFIFADKGDNIDLEFDGKDFFKSVKFKGSKASENDFLAKFNQQFSKEFNTSMMYAKLKESGVDAWEMALFDTKRAQTKFYREFPGKDNFSEDFKKYLENQIRWNYWHLLLAYPIVRGNSDPKVPNVLSLPSVLLEGLDEKKIQDENAMLSSEYRAFVNYYVTYYNSKDKGFVKYADMSKMIQDKHLFAREHLQGKAYQYILAGLLYDRCEQVLPSVARNVFSALSITPNSEAYAALIREKCGSIMSKKDEEVTKKADDSKNWFRMLSLKGDTLSLASLKGKVVYIDFWASWCGPCRMEFPYSKQLHAKLTDKQKKDIVFLYISIDDTVEIWKKAIESLKLDNGLHGLSLGGWASQAAKFFNINAIPRYILINKEGVIVNNNARRPSDPAILNDILQLTEGKK